VGHRKGDCVIVIIRTVVSVIVCVEVTVIVDVKHVGDPAPTMKGPVLATLN